MNQKSKRILEAYIESADALKKLGFLKKPKVIKSTNITKDERGDWQFEFNIPSLDEREAMINRLRPFIQDNDKLGFNNVANLLNDPGISDEWKGDFDLSRRIMNDKLARIAWENEEFGRFTFDDVINIYFYGVSGHLNFEHRRIYKKIVRDEFIEKMFADTLVSAMIFIVTAVISVGNISRRELGLSPPKDVTW